MYRAKDVILLSNHMCKKNNTPGDKTPEYYFKTAGNLYMENGHSFKDEVEKK